MDHFGGQFANAFPDLINAAAFEVTAVKDVDENRTMVEAAIFPRGSEGSTCSVTFALRKKTIGSRKGSWLTKMLLPSNMQQAVAHIDSLVSK